MNTDIHVLYPPDTIRQISYIKFDVLGADEIKKMSAIDTNDHGLHIPELFDNTIEPKKGGLIDLRMGTTDLHNQCATCKFNTTYCIGHFGHIDLAEPVFHIGYLDTIKRILDCVCLSCSKILLPQNDVGIIEICKLHTGRNRLNEIRNFVKNIQICKKINSGCGAFHPKLKKEINKKTGFINLVGDGDSKQNIYMTANIGEGENMFKIYYTPDVIYNILKNISDDDCYILGMDPKRSRPENMIHKIFPVPPVQMRPSARGDFMGGTSREDDLTRQLADIIKSNIRLLKQKETKQDINAKYSKDYSRYMQMNIAIYYDKDAIINSMDKNNTFKPLVERLKGKNGIFRNNLLGKRTNYTARTVITSDPNISNTELGVPVKIAMHITFPEVVTSTNIEYLTKLVSRGSDEYPGANLVYPYSSGSKRVLPINLKYRKEKIDLHIGDVVERHMVTGDIVLANRQPTLHKQSMMAHRIVVVNNPDLLTFRLSVAATTPYNADFDGDEMNIFVPQSIATQIELDEIANVKLQIITPTSSRTIIGIVQDGLIGTYNMTSDDIKINWKNAMNILSYTTQNKIIKKDTKYTGKELFSYIIPPNITIERKDITIKNSKIIKGRLSKPLLGPGGNNNIIQLIWDEHGADITRDFIDDTQKIANNYNMLHGFTVGIDDTIISKKIVNEIYNMYRKVYTEIASNVTNSENNYELLEPKDLQSKLLSDLSVVKDNVSKIIDNLPENNFKIMTTSGSKGSTTNTGQICGCIGLTTIEEVLIKHKYNNRTLSYFHEFDCNPDSVGFIKNSFRSGITFTELVYNTMFSREGLINTAIKTGQTGYLQRKLIKVLEDIMVKYDGTVRTNEENVLQYIYGDSGLDATKQYEYEIKLMNMSDEKIINTFGFNGRDKYVEMLIEMRDFLRTNVQRATLDFITLKTTFMIHVNLTRIVTNVKNKFIEGEKLDNQYVLNTIEKLCNETIIMCKLANHNIKQRDEMINKSLFRIALHDALAPKLLTNVTKIMFDNMINDIKNAFDRNVVEPGEMIGIIAAQSFGEPLTQMSQSGDTQIMILKPDGEIYKGRIDKFCDKIIGNSTMESVVVDVDGYYICNVSNDEVTSWSAISQISRHPPNGKCIKIYTNSGRYTCTTLSHSHLKRTKDGIIPILGSDLKVGDRIPIASRLPFPRGDVVYTFEEGVVCGEFLAGKKIECEILKNKMEIPEFIYRCNSEFLEGLLSGYIEINSEVYPHAVKLTHHKYEIIEAISYILLYFGTFGRFIQNKSEWCYIILATSNLKKWFKPNESKTIWNMFFHSKFKDETDVIPEIGLVINEIYASQNIHWREPLNVARYKCINIYNKIIKEANTEDSKEQLCKLYEACYSHIIWDAIVKIEIVDSPTEYVYDFTVPGNESFLVDNGIFVHNTINSFHSTGSASLSHALTGVQRIQEIFGVSKAIKTPVMTIHLTEDTRNNKEMAKKIASHIRHTTIGNLRNKIEVYYDPINSEENELIKNDHIFIADIDISELFWLIRIEIDREKMLEKEVTLIEIKNKITSWWNIRNTDSKIFKKDDKKYINKISALVVLTNTDNDQQPVLHLRCNIKDINKDVKEIFNINVIDNFIEHIIDKFPLKGINGIEKIYPIAQERLTKFMPDGELVHDNEYIIYTDGVNLTDIRYMVGINPYTTISNDIFMMYEMFGIEIARSILMMEIAKAYNSKVNYQHISVLVDMMTFGGAITSIDRHGATKTNSDPLSRASFEKSVEHLLNAATFAEIDSMKGVSARIMTGMGFKGGTGYGDIKLNIDMIKNSEYIEEYSQNVDFEITESKIIQDTIKTKSTNFFIP